MLAVVPIKPFCNAKSRLSSFLSPEERELLCLNMLEDVIVALTSNMNIERIYAITSEPSVYTLLDRYHCQKIDDIADDPDTDNNRFSPYENPSKSLSFVAQYLGKKGAQSMMYIPADVPSISQQHINTLLSVHSGGITIAKATVDNGTNALVCSPPTAIPFQFGLNSCERHIHLAKQKGYSSQLLQLNSLSRDVDEVTDLTWLLNSNNQNKTIHYLKESGIAERLFNQESLAV